MGSQKEHPPPPTCPPSLSFCALLPARQLPFLPALEAEVLEAVTVNTMMNTLIPSTTSMESMMTSTTQTLERRGTDMRLEIWRENIMSIYLMEEFNMSNTMQMVTMEALLWTLLMKEKRTIQITMAKDMEEDICSFSKSELLFLFMKLFVN